MTSAFDPFPSSRGDEFTTIDLFSGAGGMAEGFRKAGYRTLVATDYDEMAAKTFRHNHPSVPFVQRDIHQLSSEELLNIAGKKRGEVGVVCGGPPCQGFSLAGQRLADDPRNEMFREFVRIVKETMPAAFLFENVSGLVSMQAGGVLSAILAEFSSIGFQLSYQIMNAVDFGVPQARPRFILVGTREGAPFTFPLPTHRAPDRSGGLFDGLDERPFHLTAWDALSDLPELDQGEGAEVMCHEKPPTNDYQRARRGERTPGMVFNHRATGHSAAIQERYAAIPEGGDASSIPFHLRTKKNNVFKVARDRPARTVTCNHRTDLLHPVWPRGTTVREAARLQSFDDDYQFFGNLTRKAKWITQDDQVGNAVPPLLAQVLATEIASWVSVKRRGMAHAA